MLLQSAVNAAAVLMVRWQVEDCACIQYTNMFHLAVNDNWLRASFDNDERTTGTA
jgi:hypothetical protein